MFRLTRKYVEDKLGRTAAAVGWNTTNGWHNTDGHYTKCTLGYIYLSGNHGGALHLFEVVTEGGGVRTIFYANDKRAMCAFFDGIIQGFLIGKGA